MLLPSFNNITTNLVIVVVADRRQRKRGEEWTFICLQAHNLPVALAQWIQLVVSKRALDLNEKTNKSTILLVVILLWPDFIAVRPFFTI